MVKKREIAISDDSTLDSTATAPEALKSTSSIVNTPALQTLLDSGIITIVDGAIVWREGHLEHIANLMHGDPQTTRRNYADEFAVIEANPSDKWAELYG